MATLTAPAARNFAHAVKLVGVHGMSLPALRLYRLRITSPTVLFLTLYLRSIARAFSTLSSPDDTGRGKRRRKTARGEGGAKR